MSPLDALNRDMRWLFTDEGRAEFFAQAKLHAWTEQEDSILIKYFPNYSEVTHRLRNRTLEACRNRARRLGLTKRLFQWAEEETRWLKRNYKSASWGEMLENLPRRSVNAIKIRAHHLRLYRHRKDRYVFNMYILDEVLSRASSLKFSMSDLDEEAGTYAYFRQMSRNRWPIYVRMDAIEKAVKAMGGRIVIQWSDE